MFRCLAGFFAQVHFTGRVTFVIGDQAVVFTIHERGGDHEVSRSPIAGNGNIPHNRHAQKRLYIGVVGHGFKRVPEEDEEINFVVNDLGADLLVAANRSAFKFRDLEAKFLFQNFACCASRKYLMMSQKIAVEFCPFHQVPFFIIVRDKGYLFVMFHGNFFMNHNPMFLLFVLRIAVLNANFHPIFKATSEDVPCGRVRARACGATPCADSRIRRPRQPLVSSLGALEKFHS
jgi:hypothetical protein